VSSFSPITWIGHILKQLHILDEIRRKRTMDGMSYAVLPTEVIDIMRRYDVAMIHEAR